MTSARGPVVRAGDQPNDLVVICRASRNQRLWRDRWAVARELAAAEAFQGEIGPAHGRLIQADGGDCGAQPRPDNHKIVSVFAR